MIIEKRFNQLSKDEYYHYVKNHKLYKNFNTLALYRSIIESEILLIDEKIEIRDFANQFFGKTFEFLQVKDPLTYFKLTTLGQETTEVDEKLFWHNLKEKQDKILAKKRIKHRNFGVASKNYCSWRCPSECNPSCLKNPPPSVGMMMRGNKPWWWHFSRDHSKAVKERKNIHKIIKEEMNHLLCRDINQE